MCAGIVARKFPAQLTLVALGSRSFVSRLLREVDQAVKGCPKPVQRPSRLSLCSAPRSHTALSSSQARFARSKAS